MTSSKFDDPEGVCQQVKKRRFITNIFVSYLFISYIYVSFKTTYL
jgi:hypothetical protein